MAFVITSDGVRRLTHPSLNTVHAAGNGGLRLHSNHTLSYEAIWRTQPAVRTVVGFLARNIAQLKLHVYSGGLEETDRVKEREHPLAALLRHPLPGTKLTHFGLIDHTLHELGLYDNAFWLKLRVEDSSPPIGVLPIPARMVSIPPDEESWFSPRTYRINGTREYTDVPAEHMVHFKGYNPLDARMGVSPMETLRGILAEEISAQVYRSQLWRNGARFAGYIERPLEAPPWKEGQKERFQEAWRAQYAGDTASWVQGGGTPVLEDGMRFVPSGVTPRDAQYIESRKLTREEVASAYWLPPSAVGIFDSSSSTSDERSALYQDALPPWCSKLAQDLTVQLLYDIDPDAMDGSKYLEFNLAEKLQGSFLEQARVMQAAIGGPWLTRNEGRRVQNYPTIDGGDELIVPRNVSEGGLAGPTDTAPDNPNNEESNAPENQRAAPALERMERSVLSKVGAGATVNWDRWYRELNPGIVDRIRQSVDNDYTVANVRTVFAHLKGQDLNAYVK